MTPGAMPPAPAPMTYTCTLNGYAAQTNGGQDVITVTLSGQPPQTQIVPKVTTAVKPFGPLAFTFTVTPTPPAATPPTTTPPPAAPPPAAPPLTITVQVTAERATADAAALLRVDSLDITAAPSTTPTAAPKPIAAPKPPGRAAAKRPASKPKTLLTSAKK